MTRVVALDASDPEPLVALSASANWNQCAADWRTMLALGRGWGIVANGTLAASALVLPYDGGDANAGESRFAWLSMVLVLPAYRGRGLANEMLRLSLDHCRSQGLGAVLDATPAGHEVYVGHGFADSWGFARWRRSEARAVSQPQRGVRRLEASDWPAIAAIDRPAFGGIRLPLLERLAARVPHAALVLERDGAVCGYVLAREGRTALQIGPLVAPDDEAALGLLDAALAQAANEASIVMDLPDRRTALAAALRDRGFKIERPFTRMLHGLKAAPGDPSTIALVAGPELG